MVELPSEIAEQVATEAAGQLVVQAFLRGRNMSVTFHSAIYPRVLTWAGEAHSPPSLRTLLFSVMVISSLFSSWLGGMDGCKYVWSGWAILPRGLCQPD